MKQFSKLSVLVCLPCCLATLATTKLFGEDVPHYRGKVILVVDNSLTGPLAAKLSRLEADLVGDGWRVLRHAVARIDSPEPATETYSPEWLNDTANPTGFAYANAPRVREVRALIRADYLAAPEEVKMVFLLGRVPVPHSGDDAGLEGHLSVAGAHPVELFYGELTSPYGPSGWTDSSADNRDFLTNHARDERAPWGDSVWPGIRGLVNRPGDGKFDQINLPSELELAVGRVDLYQMDSFGTNEATLVSRYLDKDHDYRQGILEIPRRAIAAYDTGLGNGVTFGPIVGPAIDVIPNDVPGENYGGWFPYVDGVQVTATGRAVVVNGGVTEAHISDGGWGYVVPPSVSVVDGLGSGAVIHALLSGGRVSALQVVNAGSGYSQSLKLVIAPARPPAEEAYLIGFGAGAGSPQNAFVIGSTHGPPGGQSGNNFVEVDSRVAFVTLFGCSFGSWYQPDALLRAPLANEYSGSRQGYGLAVTYGNFGLDALSLRRRALGWTLGEALFEEFKRTGVHMAHPSLMGDPTLRMHSVKPPVKPLLGLVTAVSGTSVTLAWGASADATVGYNVYRAPTSKGPYVLVNQSGPISGNSFVGPRPALGPPADLTPDNFYMVRAVNMETTHAGSYQNMSEGVLDRLPGGLKPYRKILSQPVSQRCAASTGEPIVFAAIANSAAFTVEALGCEPAGNEELTFQWFKDGSPVVGGGRMQGVNTRALLITGLQPSDAGTYFVRVGNNGSSEDSAPAVLGVTVVTATDDNPPAATRNTPVTLDVLANDSNPSSCKIVSVSQVFPSEAGVATIIDADPNHPNDRTKIRFSPSVTWSGIGAYFTYTIVDGNGSAEAKVILDVNQHAGNTPPDLHPIADQIMVEDVPKVVVFVLDDDYTVFGDLGFEFESSNETVIPRGNIAAVRVGNGHALRIVPGRHRITPDPTNPVAITVTVKDWDGGVTVRSFRVVVAPAGVPTLLGNGFDLNGGFKLNINGPSDSVVQLSRSEDLVTWTPLGAVVLHGHLADFVDPTTSSKQQMFYRARHLNDCSANVVGFIKLTVPPLSAIVIANQLDAPPNTIASLFTDPPFGLTILKGPAEIYTYGDEFDPMGSWSPTGDVPLIPGQGCSIRNSSPQEYKVTFIGDVVQGTLTNAVPMGDAYCYRGSIVPQAGGISSVLGFNPAEGDQAWLWSGTAFQCHTFTASGWSPSEPILKVGEACWMNPGTAKEWTRSFAVCVQTTSGPAPRVSAGRPTGGAFTISAMGAGNGFWNVYASGDLKTWSLVGVVALNASGLGSFTDTQSVGVARRFYKLSNGDCCSQAVGAD